MLSRTVDNVIRSDQRCHHCRGSRQTLLGVLHSVTKVYNIMNIILCSKQNNGFHTSYMLTINRIVDSA